MTISYSTCHRAYSIYMIHLQCYQHHSITHRNGEITIKQTLQTNGSIRISQRCRGHLESSILYKARETKYISSVPNWIVSFPYLPLCTWSNLGPIQPQQQAPTPDCTTPPVHIATMAASLQGHEVHPGGRTWRNHFPKGDLWVFGYG